MLLSLGVWLKLYVHCSHWCERLCARDSRDCGHVYVHKIINTQRPNRLPGTGQPCGRRGLTGISGLRRVAEIVMG